MKKLLSILLAVLLLLAAAVPALAVEPTEVANATALTTAIGGASPISIKLTASLVLTEVVRIEEGKSVTIDLNGYNIEFQNGNSWFQIFNGSLTLTGTGKVYESTPEYSPIMLYGNANDGSSSKFTAEAGVTLEGWSGVMINKNTVNYGISVDINGATLTGKTDTSGGVGIGLYVNGIVDQPAVIDITDATITANGHGLYLAGVNNTTITDSEITGEQTGIEIRAGDLTVNSGTTVTGNGTPTTVNPNGNGSTSVGAGIAVCQHTTKLPIDVTINGGTIEGYTGLLESNPQSNAGTDLEQIDIAVKGGEFSAINGGTNSMSVEDQTDVGAAVTGGTFSSNISGYAADKLVVEAEGMFAVGGDAKDALTNAVRGDTITIVNAPAGTALTNVPTGVRFVNATASPIMIDGRQVASNDSIRFSSGSSGSVEPDTVYDITRGQDGRTFTCDGPYSKFVGVKVDGVSLKDTDYDVKSGSTILTLKQSYYDTLSKGEHTLRMGYQGGYGTVTFTVGTAAAAATVGNPNTGANDVMALAAALAVVSLCAAGYTLKKKQ